MRYILRRREIVADDWHHCGENIPEGGAHCLELAAGEDSDAARRALQRYDAYQPGASAATSLVAIREQRFFAPDGI